jgi:hypothetical protein
MSDGSARSRSASGAYVLLLPGSHFLFRDVIHQFFSLQFVFWIRDRVSDLDYVKAVRLFLRRECRSRTVLPIRAHRLETKVKVRFGVSPANIN